MIPRRSKVGSISVATARRELARRESERRAERLSGTRAARPPPHLPDLSRSRPKSFRRGTAIDHIVSFPSPSSIGGASDGRTDGRSKAERSGAERGPGSRLPFRLFDVARPTLVNGHGVFGSGKQLGPVVAYITIRMADRSKTSAPTYPPVAPRFTHTHTHVHARAFPSPRTRDRAPLRVYQRVQSSTTLFDALNQLSTRATRERSNPSLVHASVESSAPVRPPFIVPLPRARGERRMERIWIERVSEWEKWRNRGRMDATKQRCWGRNEGEISEGERNGRTTNW